MFHPETLDLFLSTLALLLAARMIVRDDYRPLPAVALGVALGAGQLVRAFSLWTFAVVLLALAAAALADAGRRRRILVAGAVVVAATAAVAGPWYAYQSRSYTNPIFDRPQVAKPLWERRPVEFYADPGLPELDHAAVPAVVREPVLADALRRGLGRLVRRLRVAGRRRATRAPARAASSPRRASPGSLPTALAVAGWLWLLARSLRRLRSAPSCCSSPCSRSQGSRGCSTSPSATRPRTET